MTKHTPQKTLVNLNAFDELLNWMNILLKQITQQYIWLVVKLNQMTLFSSIWFRAKKNSVVVKFAANLRKFTEKTYTE